MNRKKGDKKKTGVSDSSFDTIRIRRTTLNKLKAYKESTSVPMSAFVDEAVNERLKKLKFNV